VPDHLPDFSPRNIVRLLRLFVGLAVVLFAVWIIIGEQITGVSSDAVVNARLTTVRAPIAGTIDMPFRAFGEIIEQGEAIAGISDPLVDTIRLNDLEMEQQFLIAQIAGISASITNLDEEIEALQTRADYYQQSRGVENNVRMMRAQERVALLGETIQTDAETIEASRALEDLETLGVARDSIAENVFLGDGYNDAPVTGAILADRSAYRTSLGVTLTETNSRLTAVSQRLAQENARVALLSAVALTAPSQGVVWEVLADDGETVQRGQDILRLMKCDSALVTLSVPDNIYNTLRVGQTATFRLNGTETLYDGVITRIAGSGAETIYQNLAVAPSVKHLERYDIALQVLALRNNETLGCTVGQTGRVFFDSRPLDGLRSILN
jgi:multidrug resistance efflux pump